MNIRKRMFKIISNEKEYNCKSQNIKIYFYLFTSTVHSSWWASYKKLSIKWYKK